MDIPLSGGVSGVIQQQHEPRITIMITQTFSFLIDNFCSMYNTRTFESLRDRVYDFTALIITGTCFCTEKELIKVKGIGKREVTRIIIYVPVKEK